ncbi:hypothetical protein M8J76_012651 [Diaphorina citri]|nr:hypothetical protein M8J75_010591 [Diaphorina citri]KAI5733497.1 hypothetical protein M8J76_012651 [Diaphorina citri]
MVAWVSRSVLVVFVCQTLSNVASFPQGETKSTKSYFEGDKPEKPKDLFRIQEEAKVLLERDPKLKPQFVAIIHNKFPHPTFPGERAPWFQVYVYSDYFQGMPDEERKKYCQFIIAEKLFESGFHRVSFNCLTMEEEKETYQPPEDQLGGPTTPPSAESEYEGPMMKKYRQVLEKNFKLHHIEVIDTSEHYAQPANSEKFLTILMVSDEFRNKTEYEGTRPFTMALSGLDIFKLVTLVTVVSCQHDSEERYEYYRKKYPQVRWYTTQEPDYYDLLQTPGPTPTPDPYAAKHFDNSTEKFMGQIIFREFMPLKLTIKRHYRLQNVLRTNFEGAEAFEVFIVSKMFRGVPDWKVREQMVVNALKKDMPWDIRGLALILTSKYEYDHVPDKLTEDKLKKFAAIVHTKQLILEGGFLNKTTTWSPMEHYYKLLDLGRRLHGPNFDERVHDNPLINDEERQLAIDYHQYVEDRIEKNTNQKLKLLEQYRKELSEEMGVKLRNDTVLQGVKKIFTLTSFEERLQNFDDLDKRFPINLETDLDKVEPNKYYYEDQEVVDNRATMFA